LRTPLVFHSTCSVCSTSSIRLLFLRKLSSFAVFISLLTLSRKATYDRLVFVSVGRRRHYFLLQFCLVWTGGYDLRWTRSGGLASLVPFF
jgi:hypothetical protein